MVDMNFIIRKTGHVVVYLILTMLILRALQTKKQARTGIKMYVIAFIIAMLYAITDEYHQSLTGFRDGRWQDVLIDGAGVWLGILLYNPMLKISSLIFCD